MLFFGAMSRLIERERERERDAEKYQTQLISNRRKRMVRMHEKA